MSDIQLLAKQFETQAALTPEMEDLLKELDDIIANPLVEAAFNTAVANVDPFIEYGGQNKWKGQSIDVFRAYFKTWFTFLPVPNGGLGMIIPFSHFYLNNPSGYYFLNTFKSRRDPDSEYTTEIFNWIVKFVKLRGDFMDSKASAVCIDKWVDWLGPKIHDFIVPPEGYQSFNEFFIRELNPAANPRPIAAPDDDTIAVAPADSMVNYIISDLTLTQQLDVKSRQLNITELLNGSEYAPHFEGGTAISCVLLPENYHRYHSPVEGSIVESAEVPGIYFGMVDGDDFVNDFNFGQGTTEFSFFEDFHRAYYVIETKNHGYVGVIPVGLNTISAIKASLVCGTSSLVPPGGTPVEVQKGQELGYFAYGGSLVILLFQKGVFPGVSLLMGNRIGSLGSA